jgi:hypothetical protein
MIVVGSILGIAVYDYVARRSHIAAGLLPLIPIALVVFLFRKFGKYPPRKPGNDAVRNGKRSRNDAP